MHRNPTLNRTTMKLMQNMLLHENWYSTLFCHVFELLQTTPSRELGIHLLADPVTDLSCYNEPTVDEIAIVVPGEQAHAVDSRNIVLHNLTGDVQIIYDHHYAYVPLHYVPLFPFGTSGWTYKMCVADSKESSNNSDHPEYITQVQYYSYRLHTQQNEFPILQHGGCLFQQYVCDVWVSTDQNRLRWVENNQPHLCAALYSGLEDAVGCGEGDASLDDVGHCVVLSSSYIRGPQYMNQHFQDAIALAWFYHGFDLFITFTCNASWPEIKQELFADQSTTDRSDLPVRVFNLYRMAFVNELTHGNVLGDARGYIYTIEFQKCGLPHMHMLLSLSPDTCPTTPAEIDCIIWAT